MSQNNYEPIVRGIIEKWHNVSTQLPDIQLEGVTAEDLKVIVSNLKNYFHFDMMLAYETDILKHISNLKNPHELTFDELQENILDLLHVEWLNWGNRGSKHEFKEIIFRYINMATFAEQIEGISELKVPNVKTVFDYLNHHNDDPMAHNGLFDNLMYQGESLEKYLFYSVHYLSEHPSDMKNKFNTLVFNTFNYYNIPFNYNENNLEYSCIPLTMGIRAKSIPNKMLVGFSNVNNTRYIRIYKDRILIRNLTERVIPINEFNFTNKDPINIVMVLTYTGIDFYSNVFDANKKRTIKKTSYKFSEKLDNLNFFQIPHDFNRNNYNGISLYYKILNNEQIKHLLG